MHQLSKKGGVHGTGAVEINFPKAKGWRFHNRDELFPSRSGKLLSGVGNFLAPSQNLLTSGDNPHPIPAMEFPTPDDKLPTHLVFSCRK